MTFCWVAAFLLLAYFCHSTVSCPALCKCYPGRTEVVCNEVPLTEFPTEGLPENTTMLTIQLTNITSISEHHLKATPLLRELHVYGNHLRSLSSRLLRGVPRLHTLDLTGNKLSDLPDDVFRDAPLQNLILKNNQLQKADAKWFPDTSILTWLDLSGNQITELSVGLSQRLPHLEILDVSDNRLEEMAPNSLHRLTKLQRLSLHNNKLKTLDESVFRDTRNLTSLFLNGNQLSKLPQNLFQGLTRLTHLSLDDNQLTLIPKGLLDPLSSLEDDGLDLTVNPLLCDGEVEYLWRWLQQNKKKVLLADNITCALPESLAGRSLISLTANDLNIGSQLS
ncbi:leucine-rich alpha-2-glycoprotein [Fundulus heteroclitus]|uniref:leucine-rich alpha-2-glycoprotein n=1 Tax=Fundulus heteroclitus TaxID=8078 RepID=UPI00165AFF52|nr:leucine-rich alpha-2-glycoprotein [Fundulus heteroclitus]